MARSGLGKATASATQVWVQGNKVGRWSWLLRIHSQVPLLLRLGPAFTFPTNTLCEGKTDPSFFTLSSLAYLLLF